LELAILVLIVLAAWAWRRVVRRQRLKGEWRVVGAGRVG
jgi:hypothetical protein